MRAFRFAALTLVFGVLAACHGDSLSSPSSPLSPKGGAASRALSLGDEITQTIAAVYPIGLRTSAASRWRDIRNQLDAGRPAVAKSMLTQLAKWVLDKTPQMNTPSGGESKSHAASRLILDMSLYVYVGPNTPLPSLPATQEVAAGIVEPTTSLTLTTQHTDGSTGDGGISIDAGSVAQTTIIAISEISGPYTANCSGPLNTSYCQEPKFFHIDAFPHEPLLSPAHVQICHVNTGGTRLPVGNHDNLRVAHEEPADPADYTPGSTIVDGIEILPWNASISILTSSGACNTSYASLAPTSPGFMDRLFGGQSPLGRFASALGRTLTPDKAFAIDLGGGGSVLSFSIFGLVDPQGRPDLSVQGYTVSSLNAVAGSTVTVPGFNVANQGTATAAGFASQLYLSADATITSSDTPLGSATTGGALAPGAVTPVGAATVTIPAATAPGVYHIGPLVSATTGLSETNLANNFASTQITVTAPGPIPNPALVYSSSEQYSTQAGAWDRYSFNVTNSASIPDYLFAPSPNLPPCGLNTSASRSWVTIYDGAGAALESFCALGSANDLNSTWFAMTRWVNPPSSVYMVIHDRLTNTDYTSNTVQLFGPLFTNYPRTVELDWSAVSGAASYQVTVDFCESWASPDWRTCNMAWTPSINTTVTSPTDVITFVGDQPGRWRVQALDANNTPIGSPTPYKFFNYRTPPA